MCDVCMIIIAWLKFNQILGKLQKAEQENGQLTSQATKLQQEFDREMRSRDEATRQLQEKTEGLS